jgi:hypothetical protein
LVQNIDIDPVPLWMLTPAEGRPTLLTRDKGMELSLCRQGFPNADTLPRIQ